MTLSRRTTISLLIATGLLLRLLRLTWQPLWWDEGYSIYFATEPLSRMLWLTAHDIHPPLYYALLHSWLLLCQSAQPAIARLFSVGIGLLALPTLAWLAQLLFPTRRRLPMLALVLLTCSPFHLFYSQEIRMYGLALLLSITSTVFFWQAMGDAEQEKFRLGPWLGYTLSATLALYTLYYLALLLLSHFVWAGWRFRGRLRSFRPLLRADVTIAILYLPWVIYAGPKLIQYVGAKVRSDNDTPLTLLNYLTRHLLAFTTGHLSPSTALLGGLSLAGISAIVLLLITTVLILRSTETQQQRTAANSATPYSALWTFLLLPVALAFLLNLRFPFFPEGGERLLLFVLPYFLLLVAAAIDACWQTWALGRIALIGFLISGASGFWLFYTIPRYVAHDYRPLIQQVVQQGTDADTVLAIFPWEIGYWRAYAPVDGLRLTHGPQPLLVAEGALTWGPSLQKAIDQSLAQGTLWFPEPLSFGSTLPGEIEHYVAAHTVNLTNHWYSTATRLTAWHNLPPAKVDAHTDNFGPVRLVGAGVSARQVASANEPLAVTLAWQLEQLNPTYGVTIRLADQAGRIWAYRDYAPLGSLSPLTNTTQPVDRVGFIIPVGLPPATYQFVVGVVDSHKQLLQRQDNAAGADAHIAPLTAISITQPLQPLPAFRAPVETPLAHPFGAEGIAMLGYSGYTPSEELLAGTTLDLVLFLQNQTSTPPDRQLYVSLLDKNGAGVAGWQGWPLPTYPMTAWPPGALVQAPVTFDLPATLASGCYQLIAGLLNPGNGAKSAAASLGQVQVYQRPANTTQPAMQHPLHPPVQFGAHARLLGYDLAQKDKQLQLHLHWQVLQTLLPAHHIFVHLDQADGHTLAQADDPPVTQTGPAPTGSWRPGEYLTTLHEIPLPASVPADASLKVGLYIPRSGQRLPTSVNGAPTGDTAVIPLHP
ncbi:MAG: hypothetical protein U0350_41980 [Caldilineaceae bacterium]